MVEHTLRSIAFPTLDDAQVSEFERCTNATKKLYRDGQTLISMGDRDFKFYIVKSGEVEIVDHSGDKPKTVVIHGKGQFTGDVSHLTGRSSIVSAVARGDCEVDEVSRDALRGALNQCPVLSDIILQAFIARRQLLRESPDFIGLRVIGSRYSTDTFRVRDFLAKNRALFKWIDVETDPEVDQLLKHFGMTEADTPVVALGDGDLLLLRNPSNRQLADAIGIHQPVEEAVYDLVVVGAGPAGLAAAVYAASEGLRTVLLESIAPGGQAGSSMRIENYLGFPTGVTGAELAERAILQANKFGARLSVPTQAVHLGWEKAYAVTRLEAGETVTTKCLLIATGADYRRLDVEGCELFEGKGVYYAATLAEGKMCRGAQVVLVGGGNSAGQAAAFLAQHASKVLLLIRGDDLYKNMSSYLVHRIEQTSNIELLTNTTIRRMSGDGHLGSVEIVNQKTGQDRTVETPAVFSFIGAVPRTDWLPPEIERDARGFIRTGADVAQSPHWTSRRHPFLLETSRPGVFAAGDVRSGSIKRVASAVGEGSMVVQFVHEFLKEM
ncbi:MAG TPA: FAD-dependent oxidoreductase [Acidimicrobiales bacterium]